MTATPIVASANSDKIEHGTAEIIELNSRAILFKTCKTLFLFWGVGLLCVLLPVVHFVLVPLCFILGILLAIRSRKNKYEVLSGRVNCPRCGRPIEIKKSEFSSEMIEICQGCAVEVRIKTNVLIP